MLYVTGSVFDFLHSQGAYVAAVTFPSLDQSPHWRVRHYKASCEGFGVFALNYHFGRFKVQKSKGWSRLCDVDILNGYSWLNADMKVSKKTKQTLIVDRKSRAVHTVKGRANISGSDHITGAVHRF